MELFTPIPEAQAIILTRGVYRQVPLFTRDGKAYAKVGSGFVRLMAGGGMSTPVGKWIDVDAPEGVLTESKGYLIYSMPKMIAGAA